MFAAQAATDDQHLPPPELRVSGRKLKCKWTINQLTTTEVFVKLCLWLKKRDNPPQKRVSQAGVKFGNLNTALDFLISLSLAQNLSHQLMLYENVQNINGTLVPLDSQNMNIRLCLTGAAAAICIPSGNNLCGR